MIPAVETDADKLLEVEACTPDAPVVEADTCSAAGERGRWHEVQGTEGTAEVALIRCFLEEACKRKTEEASGDRVPPCTRPVGDT